MNLLKWFKKERKVNAICHPDGSFTVEFKKDLKDAEQSAKAAWEAENDHLKKLDACNLGTTHFAFNGTYEDFKTQEQKRLMEIYSKNGLQQLAKMQAMQNCGGHQGLGNYGNYSNNPLTRIFG